jgi:glutathione S-transferase
MLKLVIGNKNYSSWSLRPWLVLKHAGVAFEEIRIPLYQEGSSKRIAEYSPSGKVPVLIDGDVRIWDSLAICEYLAEKFPAKELWPSNPAARAEARAVSAEMHSGFTHLRTSMSMNCRARFPGKGRTAETEKEIARITAMWETCRARAAQAGHFLFGQFSVADAMYAPVVLRFRTYCVGLPPLAREYARHIMQLPALAEWLEAAEAETEKIADFDR